MIFSRQLLMNKCEVAEGYPLVFSSKRDKQARDWSITGTNIGDIGDDGLYHLNVVNEGKNLATAQQIYSPATKYEELTEDDRNCIRFEDSNNVQYTGITFKENTQYTVSYEAKCVLKHATDNNTMSCSFVFRYTDGTISYRIVSNTLGTWQSYSATSTAGKTVSSVGIATYNYTNWVYIDVDTFQLEEGATATEYEPYREPVTTEVTLDEPINGTVTYKNDVLPALEVCEGTNNISIVGVGRRNLMPSNAVSQTINGIAFTVNEDKSVTMNGTATANATIILRPNDPYLVDGKQYTLSGCTGGSSSTYYFGIDLSLDGTYVTSVLQYSAAKTFTYNIAKYNAYISYIRVMSGTTVDNVTVYPKIEEGATATPYMPYSKNETKMTIKY